MEERIVLDQATTPDGKALELALEHGHHIIRIGAVPLMSSSMRGSEEAMAEISRDELGRGDARILVGGLGMGFTLRATLDAFDDAAEICVAELMTDIIRYNHDFLGKLADYPLQDPRTQVFEGDVRTQLQAGSWDVILMDVDNGPSALSAASNRQLYNAKGVARMAKALNPGGVLVVWSAKPSPSFLALLRKTGLYAEARTVRARWPIAKGPRHTLFVANKAQRKRR